MTTEALLIMDLQNGVVARFSSAQIQPLLDATARTASAARRAGVPVIYVRIAFRPGGSDISPRNRIFANLERRGTMGEADHSTQIHAAVAPQPEDITVTKRRVSAFAGSDLEVVLRSLDAQSLTLTGIATSGVVLSTLRQAADLDFGLTVLEDCCLDADEEIHRVLMEKVFPRQAVVESSALWVQRAGSESRESPS
jgi:nicotinamidase-related amidase